MVEEGQDKRALPINYRRSVKSSIWPILAYLCLKEGKTFNQMIDSLIQREYKRRKNNEHV